MSLRNHSIRAPIRQMGNFCFICSMSTLPARYTGLNEDGQEGDADSQMQNGSCSHKEPFET